MMKNDESFADVCHLEI